MSSENGVELSFGVDSRMKKQKFTGNLVELGKGALFDAEGNYTTQASGDQIGVYRVSGLDSSTPTKLKRTFFEIEVQRHGTSPSSPDSNIYCRALYDGSLVTLWQIEGITGLFGFMRDVFFQGDNIDFTGPNGGKLGKFSTRKIGFWGATPVAQQTVASDTLANLYTALRTIGIIG